MKYLRYLADKVYGFLRAFMLWVLSAGPIPNHIAIIMDGNRRFADRMHVERRIGHAHGYDALIRILKDCFDLRVKVVSVYAFSIDNFKRSPEEVSALMDLMKSKLDALVDREDLVKDYGVRVRVLGELSLLPDSVRLAAERAMRLTSRNTSVVLNICVPYTSTTEIVKSIQRIRNGMVHHNGGVDKGNHMLSLNGYNGSDVSPTSQCDCDQLATGYGKFRNEYTDVKLENGFSQATSNVKLENGFSHAATIYKLENGFSQANINGKLKNGFSHGNSSSKLKNEFSRSASESENSFNGVTSNVKMENDFIHETSHAKLENGFSHGNGSSKLKNGFSHSAGKSENWFNSFSSNLKMENGFIHATSNAKLENGFSHSLNNVELDNDSNHALSNGKLEKTFRYTSNNLHLENTFTENGHCNCDHNRLTKFVRDSISEEIIDEHLYTGPNSTPDLVIRTSGETRLSNFMLWQASFSHLAFSKILWPEFSLQHLFFIILEYQRAHAALARKRDGLSKSS